MVATIAQMASAEYYLESQRSYRHPNEYYTAGEEPDGTWFNPHGMFGLNDGGKVDSADFQRLYNGFDPDGAGKLVQRAGSNKRSPGIDMTFSVDKSVSALWAIAEPGMRAEIEGMAVAAARAALEDTVLRYCSYTRVTENGIQRPVAADLMGATFPHGTSRENDPQLHVHCALFNIARTHDGGKYRAHHQYPVYGWKKATGAMFRANLAWDLQNRLGVRMEQYGPNAEFTRIKGMPEDLLGYWSKRRKAIVARAGELGIPALGNAARLAGVNKLTRAGKSHDNEPEIRHRRWRGEAASFTEREELVAAVTGHAVDVPREAVRELTARLDGLPEHLARQEAVFRRPDMVEAAANAAAGLMGREAVGTAVERLRRNPEIERLEPRKPTAESEAGMAHTEVYSTRQNLGLEQAVRDMAGNMATDAGHGLPAQAVDVKVGALLDQGYPLSEEQIKAIRFATARSARVAVIEGAAGSGKTTTLRPITDLHREHGYQIIPTAVAWRTAVALGDDCDARPYCVDKLLKLTAKGQIAVGKDTLIVVDEAGMLSTRQAHHILQLSERHGAKVVFAGDTRQQQPVGAGPGLRLIRDVAGSVRVDRIRRQKADLEDVLVYVHGETPEAARFQAGMTGPKERDAILAEYEAMEAKPSFTPWQVSASEALRDGDAAAAIEALRVRGRLHLCHDEEKTLTRLVEDWERHVGAEPDRSVIVLARTRAETRALSYLMRERVLRGGDDINRAVIEVSRDVDGRVTEPLEIAVGDRLRIGATQWEKQLFNGTVITVEDLEAGRKKRSRPATEANAVDTKPEEPSVLITGRTDDGRRVTFSHDEIRDYKDNIRLDYGYALTIASAQGLTVDRAFLLADARPARETIYPAATRHREALDIYVNRAPIVFDITERRPEDQAEQPVTDTGIRTHLAERWARSQPKEAALDYIADGAWRDPRDKAGKQEHGVQFKQTQESAANDNAIIRIAGEIRYKALGWLHGATVDEFAAGRAAVLEEYDEHRERIMAGDDTVGIGAAFGDTLARHEALLKVAEPFRARPKMFDRLLAERGGIDRKDLDGFEAQYARARKHRSSVALKRTQAWRPETVAGRELEQESRHELMLPRPGPDTAVEGTAVAGKARPDWQAPFRQLRLDWNQLIEQSARSGKPVFYMEGYEEMIARARPIANMPDVSGKVLKGITSILEIHDRDVAARKFIENYLADGQRCIKEHDILYKVAKGVDEPIVDMATYPEWQQEADRLIAAGTTIMSDALYGQHLDNMPVGRLRAEEALSDLQREIERDGLYPSKRETRENRGEQTATQELQLQHAIRDDNKFADKQKTPVQRSERVDRDDDPAKPDGMDAAPDDSDVRILHEALQRDWNQLDERADRSGGSVFDIEGSEALIARMRSLMESPDLPAGPRQELTGVLENYQQHIATQTLDRTPSSAPAEPPSVPAPAPPAWRPAYEALARDCNALREGARQSGNLSFYSKGYADLIPRIRELAENKDIPSETRAPMIQALENHERHVSTRKKVGDWLTAVERHMDRRDYLEDAAGRLNVPVAEAPEYPDWKREADRLTTVGKAILSDTKTYGAHLANITRGETRMKWGLSDLRDAIREIAEERTERQVPEQAIEPDRDWRYWNELAEGARLGAGPIFGSDTGSLVPPDTADGTGVEGALFRLRRTLGWESYEDHVRKRAEEDMRHSQDRWEKLRQDWNREVEHAKQAGIHVIYTHRYQFLRGDLESMANDTHIGRDLSPAIDDALNQLGKAEASRKHIEMYRDSIVEALAQRLGKLEAKAAGQGVEVPEHKDYRIWRAAIDEAVNIAEGIIANRGTDNIHFAGVASRGEGLGPAISRAREVLHDDDRQISRVAKRQRQAEAGRNSEGRLRPHSRRPGDAPETTRGANEA